MRKVGSIVTPAVEGDHGVEDIVGGGLRGVENNVALNESCA